MGQEEFIKSMVNAWGMGKEESYQLLDEKVEVLTAIKNGKKISEISNFYDILELYPKRYVQEGVVTDTYWD